MNPKKGKWNKLETIYGVGFWNIDSKIAGFMKRKEEKKVEYKLIDWKTSKRPCLLLLEIEFLNSIFDMWAQNILPTQHFPYPLLANFGVVKHEMQDSSEE